VKIRECVRSLTLSGWTVFVAALLIALPAGERFVKRLRGRHLGRSISPRMPWGQSLIQWARGWQKLRQIAVPLGSWYSRSPGRPPGFPQ
jgi:hypothetical protein